MFSSPSSSKRAKCVIPERRDIGCAGLSNLAKLSTSCKGEKRGPESFLDARGVIAYRCVDQMPHHEGSCDISCDSERMRPNLTTERWPLETQANRIILSFTIRFDELHRRVTRAHPVCANDDAGC